MQNDVVGARNAAQKAVSGTFCCAHPTLTKPCTLTSTAPSLSSCAVQPAKKSEFVLPPGGGDHDTLSMWNGVGGSLFAATRVSRPSSRAGSFVGGGRSSRFRSACSGFIRMSMSTVSFSYQCTTTPPSVPFPSDLPSFSDRTMAEVVL